MKKIVYIIVSIIFWIGLWYLIALLIKKPLLFPLPHMVLKRLGELIITAEFLKTTLFSLIRVILGICLSILLGVILGIICAKSTLFYNLIHPIVVVIKSTPVASFIILVMIFLQRNMVPIFISILMVFPIIWTNVLKGFENIDKDLLEICEVYKIPFLKKLKSLIIPSIIPYFISACLSSVGLAWKASIAAEILCVAPFSIGKMIYNSKLYLETTDLFAWTLTVIILSLILEFITSLLIKKLLSKKAFGKEQKNEN